MQVYIGDRSSVHLDVFYLAAASYLAVGTACATATRASGQEFKMHAIYGRPSG
jgi:hypothetical protein